MDIGVQDFLNFILLFTINDFRGQWFLDATRDSIFLSWSKKGYMKYRVILHGLGEFQLVGSFSDFLDDFKRTHFLEVQFI